MSRFKIAMLVFVMALIMTGCKAGGSHRVVIFHPDQTSMVSVARGATVEIVLPGNPSTGYAWEVSETDEQLLPLVSSSYESGSDMPGAGGEYRFEFNATGKGLVDLRLVYKRPWEAEVLKTFAITLKIS